MTRASRSSGVGRSSGAAGIDAVRHTVALWGNRGSGKSGVIGALRSESAKTVGERWAGIARGIDDFEHLWDRAQEMLLFGLSVRVASVDDLDTHCAWQVGRRQKYELSYQR